MMLAKVKYLMQKVKMDSLSKSIRIKEPQEHAIRMIAVPDEQIKCKVSEVKYLESKNNKYEVIGFLTCIRGDFFSKTMWMLALGVEATREQIFDTYPFSKSIIIFTVRKI